jgi:hypothetical protein
MASLPQPRPDGDPDVESAVPNAPIPFDPEHRAARAGYRSMRVPGDGHYRGALILAGLCAAAIFATWAWPDPILAWLEGAVNAAQASDGQRFRLLATTALGAVAALGLIAAWGVATRRGRPVRLAGRRGTMALEEIADGLRGMIVERPDILDAHVRLENHHGAGVRVTVWLEVTPHAHLQRVTMVVSRYGELLLHERLGVPMAEPPSVHLSYTELDLTARRTRDRSAGGNQRSAG